MPILELGKLRPLKSYVTAQSHHLGSGGFWIWTHQSGSIIHTLNPTLYGMGKLLPSLSYEGIKCMCESFRAEWKALQAQKLHGAFRTTQRPEVWCPPMRSWAKRLMDPQSQCVHRFATLAEDLWGIIPSFWGSVSKSIKVNECWEHQEKLQGATISCWHLLSTNYRQGPAGSPLMRYVVRHTWW